MNVFCVRKGEWNEQGKREDTAKKSRSWSGRTVF